MSFQAGFARLAINPELGHPISGYYIKRNVEGYLDDVEVNALALKAEEEPVVFLSLDVCSMAASSADKLRDIVSEKTGLSRAGSRSSARILIRRRTSAKARRKARS